MNVLCVYIASPVVATFASCFVFLPLRNQQEVHPQTVALQLRVGGLAKLLAHNAARYSLTSRQAPAQSVLARVAGALRISPGDWAAFAQELYS